MENVVGVTRGSDMPSSFDELLALTGFNETLLQAHAASAKDKRDYKIAIKPNMMVFINPKAYLATVTDKDLVERLVDRIISLGFSDISVCEAQHDVGRMLNNHNVQFVASKIGYQPRGRYRIADLSLEALPFDYIYRDARGRLKTWRDVVGKTWNDADFRISFAKCKTHEHDWMTLGVKNIYGCFAATNKIARYHIRNEVFDVTARSLRNFPVHFSFVDGWLGSDGFQGYKIPHPRELKMLFGGNDVVAVDMEIFRRAGLDPGKSKILRKAVQQIYGGVYPQYVVRGDQTTHFDQLGPWENIRDDVVASIDILEEVYISWAVINLKPTGEVADFETFPPKGFANRLLVWISLKLYNIFKLLRFFRKVRARHSHHLPS